MKTNETNADSPVLRETVRELTYRFAQGLDDKDWPLLQSLLGDCIDADYSAYGLAPARMGAADLVKLFRHSFGREGLVTQHLYTNHRFEFSPSGVQVTFNFLGHHFLSGAEGGNEFRLLGGYRQTWEQAESGWRITGLRLRVFQAVGNPAVLQA